MNQDDTEELVHPRTGAPVTRKMARDLGFLEEAEEAARRGHDSAQPQPPRSDTQEPIGVEIEDFLDDVPSDFAAPSASEVRDEAEDMSGLESDDEATVVDEEQWLSEEGNPAHVGPSVKPFYSSSPNARHRADADEEQSEPEIDQRERDWTDNGRRYTRDQDGGMRVS